MAKEGRVLFRLSLAAVVALGLVGCGSGGPPSMPSWTVKEQAYTPATPSTNAFDYYAVAAHDVEQSVPEALLNRVFFDRKHREEIQAKVGEAMQMVVSATSKKSEFRYVTPPVFTPPPYQRGWRIIGRAMRWKIEEVCAVGAYDTAIAYVIAATKFGFDLTGGAATDASLGFEIADEARRAIAPHLPKLGAGQLATLSDGMKKALADRPSLTVAIEHEHSRMLQGVQYVQDSYAGERWDDMLASMKESVRDAVQYLHQVKAKDAKLRPQYFEGFAKEAEEKTRWLKRVADLPASQRETETKPALAAERPWRAFAKHFFSSADPLLTIQDNTVARTRLLIISCEVLRRVKASGTAPKGLGEFPKELAMDPYTGRNFVYRVSGTVFDIYSVGSDGIDNAGETDESFTTPDLKLEK